MTDNNTINHEGQGIPNGVLEDNAPRDHNHEEGVPVPERVYYGKDGEKWPQILRSLLQHPERADMDIVARGVRIPIWSTWLQIRSRGFRKLIKELEPDVDELVLDEDAGVIKHVINYAFTGTFGKQGAMTWKELLGLIDFDSKIFTAGLKEKCCAMLKVKKRINSENALQIFATASNADMQDLQQLAEKFVLRNAKKVFETEDFLSLTESQLLHLLEKDELNCSEADLFRAVMRWGTNISRTWSNEGQPVSPQELRTLLGPLLSKIRFPLMMPQEIADLVRPTNILTVEERGCLYDFICTTSESKPQISGWNITPRVYNCRRGSGPFTQGIPNGTCDASLEEMPTEQHGEEEEDSSNNNNIHQQYPNTVQTPVKESTSGDNQNSQKSSKDEDDHSRLPESHESRPYHRIQPNADVDADMNVPSYPQPHEKDPSATKKYKKKDAFYGSWEEFLQKLSENDREIMDKTHKIVLKDVTFRTNYPFLKVAIDNLRKLDLDINIIIQGIELDKQRFEVTFDITKYIFFRAKDPSLPEIQLNEYWDLKIPINLQVNGVTKLRMDHNTKEVRIGFRNDSMSILSGVGNLQKLCLMKTDVPNFKDFPSKILEEVLFYHTWSVSEYLVGSFIRKCQSLKSFCCWPICPWWEHNPANHTPTILDLAKDLVSENLEYLTLSKVVLEAVNIDKKTVKLKVTELHLDTCFWPDLFSDTISKLFPNLRRIAIRQRHESYHVQQGYKSSVSVKMLYNIFRLPRMDWIRIWGVDWKEFHLKDQKPGNKNLRSTVSPVTEEEYNFVRRILTNAGLPENCSNFILTLNHATSVWEGEELDDKESDKSDVGFWDRMDKLDFEYFKLGNFFRDYQTFQNNFHMNLELP